MRNSVQVWAREEVAETHRLCGKIPPSLPDPVYFWRRGVGGGAGGDRIEGQGRGAALAVHDGPYGFLLYCKPGAPILATRCQNLAAEQRNRQTRL